MAKVKFFDIEWDTDGASREECGLPSECILEMDADTDVEEQGADHLSDKYGFCVKSFNFDRSILTINEQIEALKTRFRRLSKSRQSALRRDALEYVEKNPACADHSAFWRGLSARQVAGILVPRERR